MCKLASSFQCLCSSGQLLGPLAGKFEGVDATSLYGHCTLHYSRFTNGCEKLEDWSRDIFDVKLKQKGSDGAKGKAGSAEARAVCWDSAVVNHVSARGKFERKRAQHGRLEDTCGSAPGGGGEGGGGAEAEGWASEFGARQGRVNPLGFRV